MPSSQNLNLSISVVSPVAYKSLKMYKLRAYKRKFTVTVWEGTCDTFKVVGFILPETKTAPEDWNKLKFFSARLPREGYSSARIKYQDYNFDAEGLHST